MVYPPSTTIACPMTELEISEQNYSIVFATSDVLIRPIGSIILKYSIASN
jgi:hypothetical protein